MREWSVSRLLVTAVLMRKRDKPSGDPMRLVPQSCPDCSGVLQLAQEGHAQYPLYCCQIGHRYSTPTLLCSKEAQLERCLWSAVVLLKQMGDAYEQLSNDLPRRSSDRKAVQRRIKETKEQGFAIRKIIEASHVA